MAGQRLTMLTQMKPFKGLAAQDPSEHLDTLKRYAALLQLIKGEKALALPITLAEAGDCWYGELSISVKSRYSQLRQAFVTKYIDLLKANVMKSVRDCKQRRGQTVEKYTNETMALMSRTSLNPLQKALDYTDGLLPEIKHQVNLQDCQDIGMC